MNESRFIVIESVFLIFIQRNETSFIIWTRTWHCCIDNRWRYYMNDDKKSTHNCVTTRMIEIINY